jgi:hypothetical protein
MPVVGLQWLASIPLLLLFVIAALSNIALLCLILAKRFRGTFVPIVGGVAGMLGCLIYPHAGLRGYWWVPLFADLGTLPMILPALAYSIWHACGRKA